MSSFKDVVGHKNIIKYIESAGLADAVSHAYILNGERGSGKKLLANLFAMSLQCQDRDENGEACGKCQSCKQALHGNQSLLILDDPTAGLDPKQRVIIRNLTDRMGQEKIILITTHIISDIETIADKILLLRKGTLLTHGTVSELIEQVQTGEKTLENLYLQYYGGEANAAGGA